MFKKYLFLLIIAFNSSIYPWSFFGFGSKSESEEKLITIMIDPAGDAKSPGRSIDEEFEANLTIQFAQELKKLIEAENKNIRIILTKSPDESIDSLQNAAFANRISPKMYLNIGFYVDQEKPNNIYIYHLIHNPVTDFWTKQDNSLKFYPIDQAYKINLNKTVNYAKNLFESFKTQESNFPLNINNIIGIPFKPLNFIVSPALGIEIGVKNKNNIKELVEPIKNSIIQVINNINLDNQNE